jgi:hypothetical protein
MRQPPAGDVQDWHYEYDALHRLTYACSDWDGAVCRGDAYTYDGAGNLLAFDRFDSATLAVETVAYVYNGTIKGVTAWNNPKRSPPNWKALLSRRPPAAWAAWKFGRRPSR